MRCVEALQSWPQSQWGTLPFWVEQGAVSLKQLGLFTERLQPQEAWLFPG